MNRKTKSIRNTGYIVVGIVSIAILMCGCWVRYLPYSDDSGPTGVKSFRITESDLSGWKEDDGEGFQIFVGEELYRPINGGAPQYLQKGCIETAMQKMQNDGKLFSVMVMDFGLAANATAMFEEKKSRVTSTQLASSFDEHTAVIDTDIAGGCEVFAHFENYYFEFSLTEYEDKTHAVQMADLFLKVYKSKCR